MKSEDALRDVQHRILGIPILLLGDGFVFRGNGLSLSLAVAITQVDGHMEPCSPRARRGRWVDRPRAGRLAWREHSPAGERCGQSRNRRAGCICTGEREGRPPVRGSRERHGEGFPVTRGLASDGPWPTLRARRCGREKPVREGCQEAMEGSVSLKNNYL